MPSTFAQTAARAASLLTDFRCERYARTVDLSLAGTQLSRFLSKCFLSPFFNVISINFTSVPNKKTSLNKNV